MKKNAYPLFAAVLLAISAFLPPPVGKFPADARLYEMRIYYAEPGKLDGLLARFRNHTTKLFNKHGMTNVGYWVPVDNTDNKLIYVLSYPNREAREQSWKDFLADPKWKKAAAKSEENGKLVTKIESVYLKTTDFSPELRLTKSKAPRAFELRTYKTTPGNQENLLARFRDHTVKLFEKHGMTNFLYWTPTEKEGGADDTLIYILAHQSKEAGLKSFDDFRQDTDWQAVRKASEEKGGGSLTVTVESVYMTPTDFSPVQ